MEIIYGSELSLKIKAAIKEEVELLKQQGKRQPVLSVILVGNNEASKSYVRGKEKACLSVGMENRTIVLNQNTTREELLEVVRLQNEDPSVDGILVQLPLPSHLNEKEVIDCIDPKKDVDGLHPYNAGCLIANRPGFVPCTPLGVMEMLKSAGLDDLSGKKAVVCGRSELVGKPLALLLQQKNATVTVVHSKTADIEKVCSQADILVAAIGRPRYITKEWIKPGAVVIDVGINRVDGRLCGDVDFENVKEKTSYISPVPKGVGPMTVCMLLKNTLEAYKIHEGV